MSNFAAMQTALSGLIAHQRALQTAGHNASNAATKGYSRQRVDMASAGGGVVPAVWSKSDGVGNGVKITGVVRIRDEFLEARALREAGSGAKLDAQTTMTGRVEMIFPEPSDVGLAHQLSELWGAFDDLANQPGASAPRVALLERARTVSDELNRGATELKSLYGSAVSQADALVSEINATAARVAELNGAIRNATAADLTPHDLADQRDLLVERLGELAGVTVRQGELGTTDVFLGGSSLVRGDRYEQLELTQLDNDDLPPDAQSVHPDMQTVQIQWKKDGYVARLDSGEVGGLLDGANRMVPHYLTQLDAVAATLADRVNTVHQDGFDLTDTAGLAFFTDGSAIADPAVVATGITASNIKLNPTLAGSSDRIAAAGGVADPANPPAGRMTAGRLDASNATALGALGEGVDSPDGVYNQLIGGLGVESQALQRRQQIQNEVIVQVDEARENVKGVNIDEEMVTLVQAQHAYAASARLMTAVDEMLQTLISRTGLVGR